VFPVSDRQWSAAQVLVIFNSGRFCRAISLALFAFANGAFFVRVLKPIERSGFLRLVYFTFGEMSLAQKSCDWDLSSEKALQLIADDDLVRQFDADHGGPWSPVFLLRSCSRKELVVWLDLCADLKNP
jgi:hypothetical protein